MSGPKWNILLPKNSVLKFPSSASSIFHIKSRIHTMCESKKMCTFFGNVHIFEFLEIGGRLSSSSGQVIEIPPTVPSASFCFWKWCLCDVTKLNSRFEILVRKVVYFDKKCAHFWKMCTFYQKMCTFTNHAYPREQFKKSDSQFSLHNFAEAPDSWVRRWISRNTLDFGGNPSSEISCADFRVIFN